LFRERLKNRERLKKGARMLTCTRAYTLGFDTVLNGGELPSENELVNQGISIEEAIDAHQGGMAAKIVLREMMEDTEMSTVTKEARLSPAFRAYTALLFFILAVLFLLVTTGCSSTASRVGSIGALADSENAVFHGRIASFEKGRVGFFASISAGGTLPSGDEFGEETGPLVPGPESALSNSTGDVFLSVGAAAGATYMLHENVGAIVGLSLWGEESYTEYRYETPFSGEGKYFTENGVSTRAGAVIGLEFFNDSDTSLGVFYDSAPGEEGMIGVTLGFSF